MQFDMQPTDLTKLVDESIKVFSEDARAKNIKLAHYKMEPLPPVYVDPSRLRQVIDNLVNNAIKYTLEGEVSVSYRLEGGNVLIIVKDTGIGISAQDQKNLFDKFYRVKNEKTVDVPGTGLGLWISREMVRKMNGTITFASAENIGSQFIISLPYMKE